MGRKSKSVFKVGIAWEGGIYNNTSIQREFIDLAKTDKNHGYIGRVIRASEVDVPFQFPLFIIHELLQGDSTCSVIGSKYTLFGESREGWAPEMERTRATRKQRDVSGWLMMSSSQVEALYEKATNLVIGRKQFRRNTVEASSSRPVFWLLQFAAATSQSAVGSIQPRVTASKERPRYLRFGDSEGAQYAKPESSSRKTDDGGKETHGSTSNIGFRSV